MKHEIETILRGVPDVRINRVGTLWQIGAAGLSGAREDGLGLARDLKAQYEYRKAREAREAPIPRPEHAYTAEPEPAEIPAFLKEPPAHDPRLDLKDARIAELEAALAAAAAPKPEPVSAHIPPPDIADLIEINETPPETHTRLTRLYAEAKQGAELARTYGGTFNGKSIVEWERKAERFESGIKWNRGRLSEVI